MAHEIERTTLNEGMDMSMPLDALVGGESALPTILMHPLVLQECRDNNEALISLYV